MSVDFNTFVAIFVATTVALSAVYDIFAFREKRPRAFQIRRMLTWVPGESFIHTHLYTIACFKQYVNILLKHLKKMKQSNK